MLEIEILKVVALWVIGLYVNIDVTKNNIQHSCGEKGNKSGIKPPVSEGSIADDCKEEVVWPDQRSHWSI